MRPTDTSYLLTLLLGLLLLCTSSLGSTVSARSVRARDASLRRTLPTTDPYGSFALGKRDVTPPVPSVQDCRQELNVGANKAVFYVGTVQASADQYAKENGKVTAWTAGLTDYENKQSAMIEAAENATLQTWGTEDYDTFWSNASKAFALMASGAVTVVLPAGQNTVDTFPADSYWTTVEYPILTDSTQNHAITNIDALVGSDQEVAPTGPPTRIWSRP